MRIDVGAIGQDLSREISSTMATFLSEQGEALRQIIATTQTQQAAERQALSAVVADVKGELRRVLEQTEKFHQQALGIALAHARAGLMPAVPNELAALKEELSRQGITMDQVGAVAGVHRTYVCNVLAGRSTSAPVLAAIAKLLKTETAASSGVDLVARATALGWSQNELGRRAGVNNSTLSKALRGLATSAPALEAAERVIAEAEQGLRKAENDPARLKAAARRLGITHAEIAAEAAKTSAHGGVGITSVSKTLSGTSKSSHVIAAVQRLIEQAKPEPAVEVEQIAATREAALVTSGHTKADVMRLAGVSERMVYFWYRGEKSSTKIAAAHRALTGAAATSVSKPPVLLPQRVGAGHPALAQRLRELGIAQAEVAQAMGCSRSLVTFVLMGHTAGGRGINTAVVRAAERLIAQASGGVVPTAPAASMREERRLTRRDGRPSGRAGSWRSTGERSSGPQPRTHRVWKRGASTSSSPPPASACNASRAPRGSRSPTSAERCRGAVRARRWWRPRSGCSLPRGDVGRGARDEECFRISGELGELVYRSSRGGRVMAAARLRALLLLLAIGLMGCATTPVRLRHPETGHTVQCGPYRRLIVKRGYERLPSEGGS